MPRPTMAPLPYDTLRTTPTHLPVPPLWPHPKVALLQDTPRTQVDRAFQQAAKHGAPRCQELRLL